MGVSSSTRCLSVFGGFIDLISFHLTLLLPYHAEASSESCTPYSKSSIPVFLPSTRETDHPP